LSRGLAFPGRGLDSRAWVFLLILAFYGSLLLHKIDLPAADDLPRHIQNGATFLHGNTDVLHRNLYAYTEGEYPTINHHWLSGVIFYLLHHIVGFDGLVVFKVLLLLGAFCLVFAVALKKADFWLVAILAVPSILVLRERTGLRPEIFSYFFIALFLYLLSDLEEHPQHKRIFWLIPCQMLWVNMHVFSSIGIALLAGFLLGKLRERILIKKLSLVLLGVVAGSLINPYGIKIFYVYYWAINAYNNFVVETSEEYSVSEFLRFNPPMEDLSVAILRPMAVLMIVSFLPALKKQPIFYVLVAAGTTVMALSSLRGFAFFGMMALPIISANMNAVYIQARKKIMAHWPAATRGLGGFLRVALAVCLTYLTVFAVQGRVSRYREFGIGLTSFSTSSSTFLKDNNIRGPIFNDPDIGSYLIGSLYPQEKVFVDNRFVDAYSAAFFTDTYLPALVDETKWAKILRTYDFNAIVVYQYDETDNFRSFIRRRIYDPEWSFVYLDPYALILLRNTAANSETIQKFAITPRNIRQKLEHLIQSENPREQIAAADIFNLVGMPDDALSIFSKVVQRWPERNNIWLIMGQTELAKNESANAALALTYFKRGIESGYETAQAHTLSGLAHLTIGEEENALKSLGRALELDPDRKDARDLLDRIKREPTL
jgi:hypothetical protein